MAAGQPIGARSAHVEQTCMHTCSALRPGTCSDYPRRFSKLLFGTRCSQQGTLITDFLNRRKPALTVVHRHAVRSLCIRASARCSDPNTDGARSTMVAISQFRTHAAVCSGVDRHDTQNQQAFLTDQIRQNESGDQRVMKQPFSGLKKWESIARRPQPATAPSGQRVCPG